MTALQSEILELKANASRAAKGVIIEGRLDRGRGPVATALIQNGTLKEGDAVVVGSYSGRVRSLLDPAGKKVKTAGPSDPVEIQGLSGVPAAGDVLVAVSDERKARQIATMRLDREKAKGKASTRITLEGLQKQILTGEVKELRLILKADVQGSVEALAESLERLSTDEVKLKVIHSSVGMITESDVMLASASNAIVLGFNVKAEPKATAQAQTNGVDIRNYNVIYEAINDLKAALAGMLAPEIRETALGKAQVRQIFVISKLGPICGSYVSEGKIVRNAKVRVRRGDEVIGQGTVGSLKRFKDDVREVLAGLACGIGVAGVNGVRPEHLLEVNTSEEVARTLELAPERTVSAARVALGLVELHLPDVESLKDKRHVLKGLKERVRARFEVSVAEVDNQDLWQRATLALAYVSADARHANEVIAKAMDFIEDNVAGRVLETSVEIL